MSNKNSEFQNLFAALGGFTVGAFPVAVIATVVMAFASADPAVNSSWYMGAYLWVMLPLLVISCVVLVSSTIYNEFCPTAPVYAVMIAMTTGNSGGYYSELVPLAILTFVCSGLVWFNSLGQDRKRQLAVSTNETNQESESASEQGVQYEARRTRITFANVVGMADLKSRLLLAGKEIVNGQRVANGKQARNGILLYGDPGNGKTFFAEALAGELQLKFLSVSNSDMASKWINNTTENVNRLFADARAQAPCVLFIDEIDSLISSREDVGGGYEEGPRITNALLTELVNIREHKVVVVAATNLLDRLDSAAIREGRFDFKVEVPHPDKEARVGLINASIKDFKGVTLLPTALDMSSSRWEGYSVARIRAVIEEAGREALDKREYVIDYPALQQAMRRVQGNQGDRLPENTPSLSDLTMMPAQKTKLVGVAHRMANIEEIESMGGTVPTGVVFYGPPGTGKTLTVRALAKDSGWALISTSGADLMNKADAVDKLVTRAKNIRPCIIFIDEADDVFADRRTSGGVASVTNKLLAAMDGAKGKAPDIVWIAATNHPDAMDEAAMRGGRFTEKVEFKEADLHGSLALVSEWMKTTRAALDRKLNAHDLAALLEGESQANIKAILQQAVNTMIERNASKSGKAQVTYEDVLEAREVVLGR